jgi:hypothetical protein
VEMMAMSTALNVSLKCSIAGNFQNLNLNFFNLVIFYVKIRSQKKNIQVVAIDRCQKKLDRCRKTTEIACKSILKKQEQNSFYGKEDKICGTDSKTYSNECELQKVTCL